MNPFQEYQKMMSQNYSNSYYQANRQVMQHPFSQASSDRADILQIQKQDNEQKNDLQQQVKRESTQLPSEHSDDLQQKFLIWQQQTMEIFKNKQIKGNQECSSASTQKLQEYSNILNNFQLKVLDMFVEQNTLLLEYKSKNVQIESIILSLMDEVNQLQKYIETKLDHQKPEHQQILPPEQTEISSPNQFLKSIFPNDNYQYQLKLLNTLEMPLYKDKNFNLHLQLEDMEGFKYDNTSKIELELALYTSDETPSLLHHNGQGYPIIRQPNTEMYIIGGSAKIERLQISEVTSHFQNSWVYLVVFQIQKQFQEIKVKPLALQIVVKSKKLPQRSRSRSQEKYKEIMDQQQQLKHFIENQEQDENQ